MTFRSNPGMQLRAAYVSFRRRIQAHCSEYGITSDQLVLLSLLAEEDGITQTTLVERSYSDAATLTAMLRLLEGSAWIRREAHAEDGRAKRIFLTNEGRRLQDKVFRSHAPLIRSLTRHLNREEQRIVRSWLTHVVKTMEWDAK